MSEQTAKHKQVEKQVKFWHERKNKIERPQKIIARLKEKPAPKKDFPPFITLSREYGCVGFEVAEKLASIFNTEYNFDTPWAAYDREVLDFVMDDMGLSKSLGDTMTAAARRTLTEILQTAFSDFPSQVAVYKKLVETIILLSENGYVIIVGSAGNVITREMKSGFHVRLVADLEWRTERIASMLRISRYEAGDIIKKKSKDRDSYMKKYVKFDIANPHNYHLIINNTHYSSEEAARTIIEGMKIKGLLKNN
jgi:cytidylate kinase